MTHAAVQFFHDRLPYWEMQHADELTSGEGAFVLAKPGETYAVYRPYGGATDLDLGSSTDTFRVRWFDPRLGGPLQTGTVDEVTGPGMVSIGEVPQYQDWLALVTRVENTAPVIQGVEVDVVSLPGGYDVTVNVQALDADGQVDIRAVGVHFVAPNGLYVGFVPCGHVGGGLYSAHGSGVPGIPAGLWTCYPVALDLDGNSVGIYDTFDVP